MSDERAESEPTADADELVVRAKSDRAAFSLLYERYYPQVSKYCLRRLFVRAVAEDVLFAMELAESADAHYAGKGVKQGAADKPIFWYKPEGSVKYRVVNADLTVKDAQAAPQVAGAERLNKAIRASRQNEK